MHLCTLPNHLLVEMELVREESTYDQLGNLISNPVVNLTFTGTFQYMEKEVLIRRGIDIETKVYKVVTRQNLNLRDIIKVRNNYYEVIEDRDSIYTDALVYLVKNIQGGINV